ncbi:hypothetical protein AHF37_07711 [Paragonimus kellicotti]|nr:hypothetical protein AHF37_07711 [Paragonimus kellicotti]
MHSVMFNVTMHITLEICFSITRFGKQIVQHSGQRVQRQSTLGDCR